jgi:hypothetical protein
MHKRVLMNSVIEYMIQFRLIKLLKSTVSDVSHLYFNGLPSFFLYSTVLILFYLVLLSN